jgi:GNAT superfamily N-acetyltransferase
LRKRGCVGKNNWFYRGQRLAEFKIVFFDEIDDPHKVTLLFQLSLYFPAMPRLLEELRANDDRYTPEFGIFALTKSGDVVAGHLLMKISTETAAGRLDVGGVNAVGTLPEFARRGAMTAVMNTAHEYFREHDLSHSVLTTSARLGAMVLYERLDYVELARSTIAIKYPNQPRVPAPPQINIRPFSDEDLAQVDQVFREAVAGSYGFIHRPNNFLRARKYTVGLDLKPREKLRIARRGEMVSGYAYWESNPHHSEAYEIMALDRSSFHALLADAEQANPQAGIHLWCDGLTNLEIGWIREAGYQAPIESYGRAIIKSLSGKTDSEKMKALYGVRLGKFRLGLWDQT